MPRAYFEDFEIGDRRETPARTMTEADIHAFAALTGDWHPLHTDAEFAAESPFGERIAHGPLILSVGSALAFRLGQYEVLPQSFIAFSGMEDVQFKRPVKIGDTIRLEMEVTQLEVVRGGRGEVTSQNNIINKNGKVVCSYVTKFLCGCAPR